MLFALILLWTHTTKTPAIEFKKHHLLWVSLQHLYYFIWSKHYHHLLIQQMQLLLLYAILFILLLLCLFIDTKLLLNNMLLLNPYLNYAHCVSATIVITRYLLLLKCDLSLHHLTHILYQPPHVTWPFLYQSIYH